MVAAKKTKSVLFAEVGDSQESETEKCEKESDRHSGYASKTLRQCLSLYKTQCKINLTFQSQKPPNFKVVKMGINTQCYLYLWVTI